MRMMQRTLKRERISTQLKRIFDYPLTVVVAAMGYGKTTSVRDFLDEVKARYAWLSVESDEASAQYIWDSLTRQLGKTEPELGNRLNALGFPIDAPQRDRVIGLIADYVYAADFMLVIEDYHLAHAPELDRLIERIVRAEISGLHVLIVSRARPAMNLEELCLKGYCYLFRSDLFEMSAEEIKEYFALFGLEISPEIAGRVSEISEGWIAAVYLIAQRYRAIGRLEPGRDLESLIETAIMTRYTAAETRLLISLCVLDSFTPEQAVYVTGDAAAAEILRRLSAGNSLMRYDERTGVYRMHHIFSGYLRKLLEERFEATERKILHKRAGEWFIENGDVPSGLKALLRAGEYDRILAEFEKPGITKVVDRDPQSIVELFAQIPAEAKYRHPIGYLTYADFYLTDVDMEGGAGLLAEIEDYYRNDAALSPGLKRRIMGEIELARSFLCFNDLPKMHAGHLKAHELLDGSSAIANKEMLFSFGSPHMLYLYHREKGRLRWFVEYSAGVFPVYCEVANGCGAGFEHLVWAEYYLETGDLAQAELYARKAIYKAETMVQFAMIICANLTLARLYLAQDRREEALGVIDGLAAEAAAYDDPIFNSTFDLCAGYIGGILGEPQAFAPWLRDGDLGRSKLLYPGMAFNHIIHAKSALLIENYLQLEVLCEEMRGLFAAFNNLFGYLHAHLLDAAAKYRLYGMEEAKKAMAPALEIGRADGIILPFAEYGPHILEILEALQAESGGDAYLDRLVRETARYGANLKRLAGEKPAALRLTEREREILRLMGEGRTNREIAAGFHLAEITVRKNITAIYRKLGVEGRAQAVKKAVEMKLM